ncbi:ATPase [Scytonema hofmannii PCC 7110]|uniref:ATPase n=1 Tax=Scytonema hofmannii PCC 7110 TaxID=128403 RepID=A0A139WU56_9CYAN|nr:ATP-binding protein [Scytonema hofmannii]KYC35937.1 ATPase [Scytonema hofmannii PCC 7110]
MKKQQLILEALNLSPNAIAYHISQELAAFYPKKALLEGSDSAFDFEKYAEANFCSLKYDTSIHNQMTSSWNGMENTIYHCTENASVEVTWEGYQFEILLVSFQDGFCRNKYYWMLADSKEIAERFFTTVCAWNTEVRSEILVFEDGYWSKNPDLFDSIQNATFENLILSGTLKQEIQEDLASFFASQDTYEACGVPWKRGILFIGSPGNGKTHAVKALINKMQQPCLYVKSLKSQYDNSHHSIRDVFQRARQTAPCILVLEDLDSLVEAENRSFFLNELDGFAANTGIVILATTNYPDRIDSAILERPSRFDRKYYFELPALTERTAYLSLWNDKFKEAMRLSETVITQIAEMTDGFSFAYLKELVLSSMMHWMGAMETGGMDKSMILQVAVLRKQMSSNNSEE